MDVFNRWSLVQFKRLMLLKEINRLLSKGMPNICLEVTIEKKWRTQNFDFLNLKKVRLQFGCWWASTHADITEFSFVAT